MASSIRIQDPFGIRASYSPLAQTRAALFYSGFKAG